jgi:hypothetical protein
MCRNSGGAFGFPAQIDDKPQRQGFVKARPLRRFTAQVNCACAGRRAAAKGGKTAFVNSLSGGAFGFPALCVFFPLFWRDISYEPQRPN